MQIKISRNFSVIDRFNLGLNYNVFNINKSNPNLWIKISHNIPAINRLYLKKFDYNIFIKNGLNSIWQKKFSCNVLA